MLGLPRNIKLWVVHGRPFQPQKTKRRSNMSAQKKASKRRKEIEKDLKNKGSFYKDEYRKSLRKKK